MSSCSYPTCLVSHPLIACLAILLAWVLSRVLSFSACLQILLSGAVSSIAYPRLSSKGEGKRKELLRSWVLSHRLSQKSVEHLQEHLEDGR